MPSVETPPADPRTCHESLVHLATRRAETAADRIGYRYLDGDGGVRVAISYGELRSRALALASRIRDEPGGRAMLLLPPGPDFLIGFFACLWARCAAIPVSAPHPTRIGRSRGPLRAITADAAPTVVLTDGSYLERRDALIRELPALQRSRWLDVRDEVPAPWGWDPEPPMLGDLAYLQYTSGSTSTPKGVELTHGNLLANLELMAVAFELSERDSAVLWLPPFHDMGLIGGLLQPLYSGFPVTLLSPVHFLEQPIRWLRALSETGATIAGGPDFAYDLCVERIPPEERAALDLSRWEIAFTGSEPVRAETLERFAATFASSGFRSEAFYPCYGLAEASLFVSGGDRSRPPTVCGADPDALAVGRLREPSDGTARRLVSCGRTRPGTTVEIVDPESRVPASPGSVGEVWVRGPSVARGYRGQPEATAATFGARTASGSREEPFLRTGDLGAIVDGELYIVGRLKDLVILQGRNLYPHDVEATASRAHPELARHPSAAFALEIGGRETLAVVHEVGRGLGAHLADRIAATIADAVASEHGARPATVVLTRPGGVPRTTSGKVRRRACRERLVAGHLPTVASLRAAAPAFVHDATTDLESRTRVFLAARLGVTPEAVDLGLPADAAGLDSIAATELAHFLESSTGRSVPLERFFAGETLRELLRELEFGRFSEPPPGNHSPGRDASRADLEGPLSVAQEALWMLHRVEPARTDYHLARAFQVPTSVDHAVLEQALRLLSERHPSLRARFEERQGELRAFLSSPEPLRLLDLPGDDEEAWRCHLEEEAYRPFDLASGPLFRATLHRARAATFLTLAAHHAVADLWSLAVVLDELPRAYEAAHEGKERLDGLPPVLDSPFDFARRQRALLRDRSREALDSHWREQLEGAADPGPLPFEPGTEGRRSGRGAAVRLHLGVGLSRDLEALAKREGVTLFVLLLAAWEAFLARATGHRNVALGVPFAGRARAALARTVAYCVNPVVLQGSVSPEASFLSHLADTRERVLEALAHAEMPFAELVRRFAPDRRVDDQPFFRVAFAMQSAPGGPGAAGVALDLDGVRLVHPALTLTSFSLERQAAPFDLTLMAARTEEGLAATLQYDTGILDRDRAARILGRFVASLEHLAGAPEAPLRALPVLSPSERSQVLSEWAVGPATSPTAPSIPAALLRRAVATPRAPALRSDVRSIDYRRLVAMGRAGARRLRAAGVRRGDRVALCLDRSVEMVAAMLAVLEAGAAYVPVEPDLPPGRRDHLLEDVGVTVVVVTESRRAGPGSLAATVMSVMELVESDDDDAADAEASLVDLDVDLEPDDLAYVMYTSGSTGEPKGVCVTHGNVLATLGAPTFADLGPGEVMAQLAPPSFDASTLEIWGPLLNGGCVALLEPGPLSLEEIGRQLRRHGVTVTWLTAGLFSLMIDTDARALDGIRQLLTGGDVVPPAQARRALESAALRLVNGYGPTEATVFSTCHSMTSPDEVEGPVPIGRPIAGRTTYVLDEDLEPVPVGVAGELWVGGAGIARGYHGRPGLTAERFLPDPIAQRPGARMYRTGDRVRWREDGRLDFLGRIDEQLKIRGFRIEPAEVERALAEHPGVDRAIVLAQGGEAASKVLVACWVPRTGCDPTPGDLRSFLAGRLPTPSVPSRFVRVHSLPLTGNGKVDRAALAVPDAPAQAPHRGPTSSPEDPLERALASLWSRVLEVPQVGVHDDFFDLGGHSLKATQLASRLHQVFRVEIPLKDLLVRPTVRGLAEALRARVEASRLERISELFLRVESLSPDEARALLTTQPSPPTARGAG